MREILRLYHGNYAEHEWVEQAIQGLREMNCRQVVRRIGGDAWRGFCRGIEITLTFDESHYEGFSAYLLAAVLDRFFALYAPVNTFTELLIKKSSEPREIWRRWPPLIGEQPLL